MEAEEKRILEKWDLLSEQTKSMLKIIGVYPKWRKMAKELGIKVESLRLDRYYSAEAYVELCQEYLGKNTKFYLIPKSNIAHLGVGEWCSTVYRFLENIKAYLEEYFQRNKSESGFSEDKKRTGWRFAQRREDRVETAYGITAAWHNLFKLGD